MISVHMMAGKSSVQGCDIKLQSDELVVGVDAHSARPNDYSHIKEHLRTVFGLTQDIWSVSSSFNLIMMINRMNKGQAQNISFCCVSSV